MKEAVKVSVNSRSRELTKYVDKKIVNSTTFRSTVTSEIRRESSERIKFRPKVYV